MSAGKTVGEPAEKAWWLEFYCAEQECAELCESMRSVAEENGGSAWESNPPATRITRRPTVLKTAGISTEPPQRQQVTETDPESMAHCVALLVQSHPGLALVVETWPELPEAIRAGIAAMVKAAGEARK
ncbi:MAG TPA: hypothetical protein VMY42_18395 [Thermoguttaceae bacterium]|nr:hypothetical protein [Thermoguttaceae bacterium]